MYLRTPYFLIISIICASCIHCSGKINRPIPDKIKFDFSTIDHNGLRNSEVAVDYEFCIPASDDLFREVLKIDEGVRLMKSSKGRIGCTDRQWLCINSTHAPGWKDKLYAIASLKYVEYIRETFYE